MIQMTPSLAAYTSVGVAQKLLGPPAMSNPLKCQFLSFSIASKAPNALQNHLDMNQYIPIIEIS